MRFKTDENLPTEVAALLIHHGHDALRVDQQGLAGVADADASRAGQIAIKYGCPVLSLSEILSAAQAAVVATPTTAHEEVAAPLLEAGLDVLIEKPITPSVAAAERLLALAAANGRMLQVGHLERFNPAVTALERIVTLPLFFEVHRMSTFSPRSLDVDVVLDLMIHDIEIVLALVKQKPSEIRAAGISILSEKSDIANVRLAFPSGCVANLTASRMSTEKVRKVRLFQPGEYISVDYTKQELMAVCISPERQISFRPTAIVKGEPLKLELEHFIDCIRTRRPPRVSGVEATEALRVATDILDRIEEHTGVVRETIGNWKGIPSV